MTNRMMDIVSALVLGALAILIHIEARGITPRFKAGVDSGFFPEIVSVLLLVLSVAIGVRALRAGPGPDDGPPLGGWTPRVWTTCALMAAAIFSMEFIGFLAAAAVFLFLQMVVLTPAGHHRYVFKAIVSVVLAVGVYFIFSKGFGLILPSGPF